VVSVISAENIQIFGGNTLFELLERVSSIYLTGSALLPDNMVSVRGDATVHYSNRVLVLIDGRPYRDSAGGGIRLALFQFFPISRIERIEIIRGPGAVLYGSGAYTGVINVITKKEKARAAQVCLRAGGDGRVQGAAHFSTPLKEKGEVSLGLQGANTAGWEFNATDGMGVNRSLSRSTKGAGLHLAARYGNFHLQTFAGVANMTAMYFPGAWSSYTRISGSDTLRNFYSDFQAIHYSLFADAGYTFELSKKWKLSSNLTYNGLRFVETAKGAADDIAITRSEDWLFEVANFIELGEKGTLIWGGLAQRISGHQTFPISLRREKTEEFPYEAVGFGSYNIFNFNLGRNPAPPYIIEPYAETWFSGYLQTDYRLSSHFKIVMGGQLNKAAEVALDFVPRLALIAKANDYVGAKLLYGEAFRVGASSERFIRVNFVFGNPSLLPEKIRTTELSLYYNDPNQLSSLTLTYFQNRQRNIITRSSKAAQDNNIPAFEYFDNSTLRRAQGFELEVTLNPLDRLKVMAYASVMESQDEVVIRSSNSTQRQDSVIRVSNLQGMPQTMAKMGISYTAPKGFSLGVFNSFFTGVDVLQVTPQGVAPMPLINPAADSFHWLTAQAHFSVGELFTLPHLVGLEATFYAENLLNQRVMSIEPQRNVNTLPARGGRRFYAGLQYRF
jgi:outer membrane receptor protein involved in Fe transport